MGGGMLISSFPLPPTGGQAPEKRHFGLTFRQRATGPQPPGQAILCGQYPSSDQKQQEAKVKVTDPTWSQNWLFSATGE